MVDTLKTARTSISRRHAIWLQELQSSNPWDGQLTQEIADIESGRSENTKDHLIGNGERQSGALPMLKTIFAISAVALLSTTYAMAQQGAVIRECAADVRAACGEVPAGAGSIRSCLNSHLADLTQPCRAVLVSAAAVANECRADITAMCANVAPGGGRIEACLQSHLTELSGPCMDVMARTVGRGQ